MPESQAISLAREFTERFNAGDVEGLLRCCSHDIEFHSTFAVVGGTTYHGHEGMRAWYQELAEAWGGEIRSEPEAFFDLGDHALVFTVIRGTGRQSGVEAALPIAAVARTGGGLLTYYKAYLEREDALDELGVSLDSLEAVPPDREAVTRSVEIVREHVEAFLGKDIERALAFLDPHVVWDASRTGGVDTGNVTFGKEDLDDAVRSYRGSFDRFEWHVSDFVELGPGVVLGLVTETGYGRQSRVPVDRSYALIYMLIEQKIARITLFPSEDDARVAIGLDGH